MPNLTIIAGCNGAGKSIFASTFLPEGLISFDYDRIYLEKYNSLPDSEFRYQFAKTTVIKQFENTIQKAWDDKTDFCYETNFDEHPIYWAEKFKNKGYKINLIFFCIDSQDIARHRIQVRTEFKGHFVNDRTIDLKWKAGYKNLNLHFKFFDQILIVDNSKQNEIYINVLQIEKGETLLMTEEVPTYFRHRLPEIYSFLND